MIEYRAIKFNLRVYGTYIKQTDEGVTVETTKHFGTAYKSVYQNENIVDEPNMAIDSLLASSSEFQEKDSGWETKNFNYFEITIIKLENIPAGGYIKAPKNKRPRNALINVQNTDVFCFKWCILAFLANKSHESATFTTAKQKKYSREKMTKPTTYHINTNNEIIVHDGIKLDFSGIEFPITNKGMIHFEKNNKDCSINIYEIDADGDKIIGPTFRTECIRTNHINILGINNVSQESMHYSQHSKAKSGGYFCDNCLRFFTSNNTTHRW